MCEILFMYFDHIICYEVRGVYLNLPKQSRTGCLELIKGMPLWPTTTTLLTNIRLFFSIRSAFMIRGLVNICISL